jgi:cobalt-zinc-cadmium efflux system membrane fusion protein
MNKSTNTIVLSLSLSLALTLLLAACGGERSAEAGHEHDAGEEHGQAEEARKGAHGGRVLEQSGYRVELAIAEAGMPPRYQAWLYRGDAPLAATTGSVEVRLRRLDGASERHVLTPRPDGSLIATSIVGEPHSFDVEVLATIEGKALRWSYPSYEGRTRIAEATARTSGIRVAPAAAGPSTASCSRAMRQSVTWPRKAHRCSRSPTCPGCGSTCTSSAPTPSTSARVFRCGSRA